MATTYDKIYFQGESDFTKAYQGDTLIWQTGPATYSYIYYSTTNHRTVTLPTSAVWDNTVLSNTYDTALDKGTIVFDGVLEHLPNNAFRNLKTLKTVQLPNTIVTTANAQTYVFADCTALVDIDFPTNNYLGRNEFKGCSSLAEITLYAGGTAIPQNVFSGCTGLNSITFPSTYKSIDKGALQGCSFLEFIKFEYNGVVVITDETAIDVNGTCPIYVPSGQLSRYQMDSRWYSYLDRIQGY